jgi:beta-mannosidase
VYSWDREVMDTQLKKVAEQWDPTRPVLRCSGKWPVPWRKDTDSHLYFGWYSPPEGPKRRLETLSRLYPPALRFVTEFGAQSFPNRESALKFMDGDLSKVDWEHLVERHHFQPNIMSVWYDWRKANNLDDLIAMSQDYQIEINQYYIDRLRLRKYNPCGGFAAFMFLDSNPAVQWSIVDYWREPKQSYAHMQIALNPEYVFALLSKDEYPVGEGIDAPLYVVNDSLWDYPGVTVRAELLDPGGRSVWQSEPMRTSLEPDCAAKLVQHLSFKPTTPGDHRLVLTMHYGEQSLENHYRIRVV